MADCVFTQEASKNRAPPQWVTDLSAHYACWAAGNPGLAASWAQNQQYFWH